MNTCKTCKHYDKQMDPNDITADQGLCKEGPPSPVVLPGPRGITITMMNPTVAGSAPQCGRFASTKSIVLDH